MKKRLGVIMYQTSRSKGQELVAQRMVSYFNKLGHDAYLITSVYHDGKEVVSEATMGERGYSHVQDSELGIPIIRVPSFISKFPPRRIVFRDVVHTLERIVNEFRLNVLITHSTLWNGPEEVAKFIEWRRNIKALGGYQDPIVFCHMSHFQEPSPRRYSLVERSFRLAWNRLSLRTILRVANLILVVTPLEQEEKVKMGATRDECILFPGGVDNESFMMFATADPEEFKQKSKLPTDAKLISYVGTIENRKNPKAILDLAERMRDQTNVHFVLAGKGGAQYSEEVRKRAEASPNVTYLGEIGEREKVQLIKASYVNILLSRMEALGLTQLEFMFLGVPVITSAVGGQFWLIRNGQEGIHLKGPRDLKGAEKAITELIAEPSKWRKLSTGATARARPFALSNLIAELDRAITRELEKESGLSTLSPEVRLTLSEPELVVRTWSRSGQKVLATDKRVFVQQGRFSRTTLEVPFTSIHSIEHMRRYRWRTVLIGAILSMVLFTQHYMFPIISRSLTARAVDLIATLIPTIKTLIAQALPAIILSPLLVSILLFALGARKGYALHGATLKPIYFPQSFGETIQYIREGQDKAQRAFLSTQANVEKRDPPIRA